MEYIIGLSVTSKHQISIQENLVYTAGRIVVYYSYHQNKQIKFLLGKAQVHAVQISKDGQYVFTGEQATKNPSVNIFKLDENKEIVPTLQLKGHKYGISQIIESPSQPYLVSLGSEHDKGLFLWDWKQGVKLTVNKLSKPVHTIRFNPTGSKMISAGQSHLKLWSFQEDGTLISNDGMLDPKPFQLNEKFAQKTFVDIVVSDKVYALAQDAILGVFLFSRQLERWMDLKSTQGFSLSPFREYLICGCSDGIIRVFNTNLQHIITLTKPPNLGNYNIQRGAAKLKSNSQKDQFADCIALQAYNQYVIAVYSDRTMFLWDISNFSKIMVKRSFLNHSGSINDLQILQQQSSIETTFFVTAASDQTLRIWHLYEDLPNGIRRNVYCKYLSRIIYVGNSLQHFKSGGSNEFSIRCVKVSKDGNYLACGDSMGKLRVFSTLKFELIKEMQIHESEILALDFSDCIDFLASGSRDRIIHIFDDQFNKVFSLEDHTSSVTHLKFSQNRLISCGLDKAIIFREYNGQKFKIYHQEQTSRVFSIDISYKHLYVCLEKKIVVFDLFNGKQIQQIDTESNSKFMLYCKEEENCQYIASYSDKMITILNNKFEVIQKFQHDHLTSMGFALDNKHFLSASNDGCIIIWKLNKTFKKKQLGLIGKKLKELFAHQDLKSSKEWTINSFWIEEELRGFLNYNKQEKETEKIKQQQKEEEENEEIELYKFDSDSDQEELKPKVIENALSPLQDTEFNYKNQKFDFNDLKNLQSQLQQVQQNISKINEHQQSNIQIKYQINKEEIIQEVNPKEEQSQYNYFGEQSKKDTRQIINETIQTDRQNYDTQLGNLQTQQSHINQTQQDLHQENDIELKKVEFDVQPRQFESLVIPNPSHMPELNNSLQIRNVEQSKNEEQLKQIMSSLQGVSRDSINLNQTSYNYDNNNSQIQKITQQQQQYQQQLQQQQQQQQRLMIDKQNQQIVFQKTNLAQYHLRQVRLELDDLQKILCEIQDPQIQTAVLNGISQDLSQLAEQIQQIQNTKFNQSQVSQSFINKQESNQLSEQEIKKIVYDCSKDLLDNYSKLLLEQIKSKQN